MVDTIRRPQSRDLCVVRLEHGDRPWAIRRYVREKGRHLWAASNRYFPTEEGERETQGVVVAIMRGMMR